MADKTNIHAPTVFQFASPDEQSEPVNQLLYGETVERLETQNEWVKAKATHDGYPGYIKASLLKDHFEKTHKVSVPQTLLFEEPNFKTPARHPLYLGCPLSGTQNTQNGFRQLHNKGWVFEEHTIGIKDTLKDWVNTAEQFLHTPYQWGGRSAAGIDCSGLVQISLMMSGIPCPRDTGQQIQSLGQNLEFGDTIQFASLMRGDLIFFERHVGIMLDQENILNASSRHMSTKIEKLDDLITAYNGILSVRRL